MTKNIFTRSIIVFLALITMIACTEDKKKRVINFPKTDLTAENMIPKPLKMIATNGGFALDEFTAIYTSKNEGFEAVGKFLSKK